jgi:diguanylate cyclase
MIHNYSMKVSRVIFLLLTVSSLLGAQEKTPCRLADILPRYLVVIILIILIIFALSTLTLYIIHLRRKLSTAEKRLDEMATYDLITGLPNRRFFQEYAEKTLDLCRRRCCRMALYYIDLDNFKPVNDTYGHETGDLLLNEVGQRLIKQMRKSDLCARLGGDEFIALIQDVEQDLGFDTVARRIIGAVSHPYFINEREIKIGVSMGLSFFPEMGSDLGELMQKADKALHEAKEKGRGSFRIYRDF